MANARESASDVVKFVKSVAKSRSFKVLEKVAGFWSPADTIIRLVISSIEPEPEDPLIPVKEKLEEISNKLDDMGRQIETSSLTILSEINFTELKKIEATINSAASKFKTMIEESGENRSVFLEKLNLFIKSFSYPTNMEYLMVQYLTAGGRMSASPIKRFSDVAKNNAKDNFCPLKSTANSMVYELHLSVMHSVFKLTTLLDVCYRVRDHLLESKSILLSNYNRLTISINFQRNHETISDAWKRK